MTGPYSLRLRASRLDGRAPTYYPLSPLTKERERGREKNDWPLRPPCPELPDVHGRSDGGDAPVFVPPFARTTSTCHPLGVRIVLGKLRKAHAHTLVGRILLPMTLRLSLGIWDKSPIACFVLQSVAKVLTAFVGLPLGLGC